MSLIQITKHTLREQTDYCGRKEFGKSSNYTSKKLKTCGKKKNVNGPLNPEIVVLFKMKKL